MGPTDQERIRRPFCSLQLSTCNLQSFAIESPQQWNSSPVTPPRGLTGSRNCRLTWGDLCGNYALLLQCCRLSLSMLQALLPMAKAS